MSISKWCAPLLVAIVLAGCGAGEASPSPAPAQTEPPVQATAPPPEVAPTEPPAQSTPEPPAPTVDINCTETNPHPMGQSIAETYQTSYEEVMTFFCTGVSFDDIVLAYQTAEITSMDVKEVMTLWYDYGNWDDVWTELGIQ